MSLPELGTDAPAILLTGASGGLAGAVAAKLASRFRIVGVDPRPLAGGGRGFPGEFYRVEYSHRKMAEIFRAQPFHAVVHLGRVRSGATVDMEFRFRHNVLGTQNLIRLARKHSVKNLIVMSTFHVYGALQLNHSYITEDEPLRAAQHFPDLADSVELDHAATLTLWKDREIRTVVLRPANIVGPGIRNTITMLLRGRLVPKVMGFDPLTQFVHEEDMALAIARSLESDHRGVYNVAGEGALPWTRAIALAGGTPVPIPTRLAHRLLGVLKSWAPSIPEHLVDYFRFPTVISDQAFRKDFGYRPQRTIVETLGALGR